MQKKLLLVLVALFFGSILVFFNSQGFLSGAKESIGGVGSSISVYFSKTGSGVASFFSGIFRIGDLQSENADLRNRLNKLEAENAKLVELRKENESLKKDLNFVKASGFDYLAAEVIAFDPSDLRSLVTINKGSRDGLKNGLAVVSEGFLIGRISEVSENHSNIMLITDPTSTIPAEVQETGARGLIRGNLGAGIILERVHQGETVDVGNKVITSGIGGEVPRGIIVGEVGNLERKENSLFINASIKAEARISNVLRVLVIKTK